MAFEAVQELRIVHRWEAMRREADDMKKTRFCGEAPMRSLRMIILNEYSRGCSQIVSGKMV